MGFGGGEDNRVVAPKNGCADGIRDVEVFGCARQRGGGCVFPCVRAVQRHAMTAWGPRPTRRQIRRLRGVGSVAAGRLGVGGGRGGCSWWPLGGLCVCMRVRAAWLWLLWVAQWPAANAGPSVVWVVVACRRVIISGQRPAGQLWARSPGKDPPNGPQRYTGLGRHLQRRRVTCPLCHNHPQPTPFSFTMRE